MAAHALKVSKSAIVPGLLIMIALLSVLFMQPQFTGFFTQDTVTERSLTIVQTFDGSETIQLPISSLTSLTIDGSISRDADISVFVGNTLVFDSHSYLFTYRQ